MNGPSDDLRSSVLEMLELAQGATDEQAEEVLAETLDRIGGMAADDLGGGWDENLEADSAFDLLGAIEAWAGLASAAVAKVYVPASPWPRHQLAGWAKTIAERLRALAQRLLQALQAVGRALGAVTWSLGLNFPWGISVTLTWS